MDLYFGVKKKRKEKKTLNKSSKKIIHFKRLKDAITKTG
jgi:hypothetical protein